MTNLKLEVYSSMQGCRKLPSDVAFVYVINENGLDFSVDFNIFLDVAEKLEYERCRQFGRTNLNMSLRIFFKDGSWLERIDIYGSESFRYRETLEAPSRKLTERDLKRILTENYIEDKRW